MSGHESTNRHEPLTEDEIRQMAIRDARPNPAGHADLDFIAGARQDIPRLIAELDQLRGELAGGS